MNPSPDQEKQRALAWSLYLVTGQIVNLNKAIADRALPQGTRAILTKARGALSAVEWQIRGELSEMVRRSLKGLVK